MNKPNRLFVIGIVIGGVIMLLVLVVVFAVILAARRGRGPHVTEITRTVRRDKHDSDA